MSHIRTIRTSYHPCLHISGDADKRTGAGCNIREPVSSFWCVALGMTHQCQHHISVRDASHPPHRNRDLLLHHRDPSYSIESLQSHMDSLPTRAETPPTTQRPLQSHTTPPTPQAILQPSPPVTPSTECQSSCSRTSPAPHPRCTMGTQ